MKVISGNAASRLEGLTNYRAFKAQSDPSLDDLTALASYVCGTPFAFIAFVDQRREQFRACAGWEFTEQPLNAAFSPAVLAQPSEPLIVADTALDERFAHHSMVVNHPHLRFLVGVALVTHKGRAIGALCVGDRIPRQPSADQIKALQTLSRQIITHLELQANVNQLERRIVRQQRVEKALHDRNQRYRQTVQELQHAQTQLIQTEKMSSLGQMVAGVAHEINNPVSFVYGNLTYVNRYIQDLFQLLTLYQRHYPQPAPEIQEYEEEIDINFLSEDLPKILNSMKVGADRIRQIVLSLRNFSRLDEADKKPVDIHQGIDSTLLILQHRLKPQLNYPGVEIVRQYGEIPPVACYAGQMNQVFMNILSNALDAMEQQTTQQQANQPKQLSSPQNQITIITERSEFIPLDGTTPQPSVVVRLIDNGPGIPHDVKEHIFDPFFTTKPVGKGTGLGLSISYQIVVERHNGDLKCVSELGKGTEFRIEIPLSERALAPQLPAAIAPDHPPSDVFSKLCDPVNQ